MEFEFPKLNLDFNAEQHTILLTLAGSRSYGTDQENSDYDYRGILIPPREYYLSPFKGFEQTQWHGTGKTGRVSEVRGIEESDSEGTIFGLQKFIHLATACNPNVVEGLFVNEKHILIKTVEAEQLIANRHLFLSQRALKTFTGYAISQLKKIKSHRNWLLEERAGTLFEPTREAFGLPPEKLISGEQLSAANAFITRNLHLIAPWLLEADNQHAGAFYEGLAKLLVLMFQEMGLEFNQTFETWLVIETFAKEKVAYNLGLDANFVEYLQKEKAFAQARQHYEQYLGWKKNRNPARAALEAQYGFDLKYSMHLVRLLRMGEEILTQGDFNVYRQDREELLAIRGGAWSYEQLIEWSDQKVDQLYDVVRSGKSVVPSGPNEKLIEKLAIEVQDSLWNRLK